MPKIIDKPKISEEILEMLQTKIEEEKQVIVHCCFKNNYLAGNLIRIWKSTFLIDKNSGHKSNLLFAENIVYHPFWMEVPPVKEYWFTLIFSGLPKDCKQFDFAEIIPESGGFFVADIARNRTDVYKIDI